MHLAPEEEGKEGDSGGKYFNGLGSGACATQAEMVVAVFSLAGCVGYGRGEVAVAERRWGTQECGWGNVDGGAICGWRKSGS